MEMVILQRVHRFRVAETVEVVAETEITTIVEVGLATAMGSNIGITTLKEVADPGGTPTEIPTAATKTKTPTAPTTLKQTTTETRSRRPESEL